MAAPTNRNADFLAQLLNLNKTDTDAYQEAFDSYFGSRCEDSDASSDEEDFDSDESEEAQVFLPEVEIDLASKIVPLDRGTAKCINKPQLNPPLADESPAPSTSSTESSTGTTNPYKCKCKTSPPCYSNFSAELIEDIRLQYKALSRSEFDIALLAKISCGIHLDATTRNSRRPTQETRKQSKTDYLLHGHKVCRGSFMYIHDMEVGKLTALISHYKACSMEARIHKNTKKLPHNTLQYKDTVRVVQFILNYAEVHAIDLPGRTPRHWITSAKLLPTNITKTHVYEQYKTASEESGKQCVHITTFRKLWRQLVPFVRTMPPATDLCWTCQKGIHDIQFAANKDEEKAALFNALKEHQDIVANERSFYQHSCMEVKKQLPANRMPGRYDYCSFQGQNHISFDFAQQTHFPCDPLQPGPMYFKTARKCGIFGLNNEAVGQQLNILIDEGHNTGKGANTVTSYLHFYLENYSLGETELLLHADNCSGQNKNSVMAWYLMWRCLTGRNERIRLSFLIAGHTKFSPDGGFGLIKRKLKLTRVDCLDHNMKVVNESSKMNTAVLVGSENGAAEIPTYDWAAFLSKYFQKVKGIKSLQQFVFDNSGVVTVQEHTNAPEMTQVLLKKPVPDANILPPIIQSPGLNLKRQQYLYKEIRPFVLPQYQDTTCPQPEALPDNPSDSSSDEELSAPPAKVPKKTASGRGAGGVRGGARGRGRSRGRGADMH